MSDGRQLGGYVLLERLGSGGMGDVWRAEHQMLKRQAAVKVIRRDSLPSEGSEKTSTVLKRFEREAQATSVLKSPHTIQLYDFGIADDGTFYYAMELLEGCNLETLVDHDGPVEPARAIYLLQQICESLSEAHHVGLIHRDIKPANAFLSRLGLRYDFVKVLDFGLVRHAPETVPQNTQLTAENVTAGSPSFMPPEAVRGSAAVNQQSDVYSLGCLAYWLLTGQLVFDAQTPLEMVLAHVQESPAAPSTRTEMTISPELDRIVMQCLEKDPTARPAGTQALSRALGDCPVGAPWTPEMAESWWQTRRPQSWSARGRPPEGDSVFASAVEADGSGPSADASSRPELRPRGGIVRPDSAEAFVGRDEEWKILREVWAASSSGEARMLLVTGEAGIGKTRLVDELAAAASEDGARIARARSYEVEGRLAWGPVSDLLRSDTLRPQIDQLDEVWTQELARLLPELRAGGPAHAESSPMTDPSQRRVLFEAVDRVFQASDGPLLLIVDDLQWCDRDSIEFLHYLLRSRGDRQLLIAGTARSEEIEEEHPLAGLRTGLHREGSILTELTLSRLDERATAELAAKLTGTALSEAATALLYRETEGNPLFVVEAVRAGLTESSARPLDSPTVRAVIESRLTKLTDEARNLLEIAATVGRQFSVDILVAAGAGDEKEVETSLEELWQRELIRDHTEGYDFSHDKIREAAYDRISAVRRRRLHKNVAAALEQRYLENLYPVSARLAAHFEAAGLVDKSIEAHRRASAHSLSVFALDDAIEAFTRALKLVERLPQGQPRDELELTLQTELGSPLIAKVGYGDPGVESLYRRVLELSKQLKGRPSPPALRGLALCAINHCRFDRAITYGLGLLDQAQDDAIAAVEAHYALGVSRFWQGALEESVEHLEESVARYKPEHSPVHIARFAQDPYAVCLSRLGLAHWYMGFPERAVRRLEEAVQVAESLRHPHSLQYTLCYAAILALQLDDRRSLEVWLQRLNERAVAVPLGFFAPMVPLLEGWLSVQEGSSRGLDLIREGAEGYREPGRTLHLTLALSWLAAAHLRVGDPSDGLAVVQEAIQRTKDQGQWYLHSELLRLEGELRAAQGDVDAGIDAIRRAHEVAAARGSRALELRAASALVRRTGDTTLLRSVYNTFTEGLDSGDLREATALLAVK